MMKKIIILFFAAFFCLTNLIAQSQTGIISGTVTDASTKQPLIGTNVLIIGSNIGSATDINGEFKITNLSPGVYQVKISMIGYSSYIKTDVAVNTGMPAM